MNNINLESYKLDDVNVVNKIYEKTIYPISAELVENVKNRLVPGKTVILFSGSYRLNFDGVYIENSMFKNSDKLHHPGTYFVNLDKPEILNLVLTKSKPSNILVLHSYEFCKYGNIDEILKDLDSLKKYLVADGQLILTIPHVRINFNRLTTDLNQLTYSINADLVGDDLIIVRK